MLRKHEAIKIRNPFDNDFVEIDKGIAELMYLLWAAGIRTTNSCEENSPGFMWIEFETAEDAEKFLEIAVPVRKGQLYENVMNDEWKVSAVLCDYSEFVKNDQIEFAGRPRWHLAISLRFPISDYKKIVDRIKRR